MSKHNIFYKSLIAASLVTIAAYSNAETVSTTATVTVQNAFTLTKLADLDFGIIRATQTISGAGFTTGAGIRILADGSGSTEIASTGGTPATDTSEVNAIVPGTPAEFSISNAASNTTMNISVPADTTLAPVSAPTVDAFDLTFAANDIRIVNSDGSELAYNGNNLTTDATGAVGFKLGGSLKIIEDIDGATTGVLDDESYTGTFDVVVAY